MIMHEGLQRSCSNKNEENLTGTHISLFKIVALCSISEHNSTAGKLSSLHCHCLHFPSHIMILQYTQGPQNITEQP